MNKDWDNPDTFPTRDRKNGQGTTFGKSMTNGPEWSYNKRARDGFIAFLREVMTEALRVLKPGGHALIWALPRTSHWTATALEDAGFEVRDKLYHLFGSGFPKSHNISVAIDKHLKAEREVIGRDNERVRRFGNQIDGKTHEGAWPDGKRCVDITAPATPEAQRWQGYGTALKPSCEEWILCRKPLAESSIAAQVLATGTGGLNIGATRISHNEPQKTTERTAPRYSGNTMNNGVRGGIQSTVASANPQGRFPSHLLLSHSLWCVPRGIKRVRSQSRGFTDTDVSLKGVYDLGLKERKVTAYQDSEGYEHVEAYDCAPDCPIAELDRQSGVRKSGARVHPVKEPFNWHGMPHDTGRAKESQYEASEGGASRYFQQFYDTVNERTPEDFLQEYETLLEPVKPHLHEYIDANVPMANFPPDDYTPFLYQSKASRAERNKGCEDLPEVEREHCLSSNACGRCGLRVIPNGSGKKCECGDLRETIQLPIKGNSHPTVKPLALMRWLIRLITPPDGIVLDPFCGSGSTLVACVQEQKHFIGIEQDASYVAICEARIAHAQREQGVTVQAQEYECAPDCPVRILGEQSGESNDIAHVRHNKNGKQYNAYGVFAAKETSGYGDTGTAARYFQQFPPDSLWCDKQEEVPA